MKTTCVRSVGVALAAVFFSSVMAFSADPTGTWKWTQQGGRGGTQSQEVAAKLSLKDGQLSGTVALPGRGGAVSDVAISSASFKNDEIAFSVLREAQGRKMEIKFAGRLAGDTIIGTAERPGRGEGAQSVKTDWSATRAK